MVQEKWTDYYALLELYDPTSRTGKGLRSTQEEIKAARDWQIRAWHPDKFKSGSKAWKTANERSKRINEAYELLCNPARKKAYDGEWLRRNDWFKEGDEKGVSPPEVEIEAVGERVRPTVPKNGIVGIPRKRTIRWWPLLAIIPLLFITTYVLNRASPWDKTPVVPSDTTEALATRAIDGDTIEVEIEGESYKVRYIGIDTPELHHPEKPVEYYAQEAYEKNRELVEGKTVYLEKDVSETDSYGRLLRYVYVENTFVNAYLVQQGYALVSTYPPDVKYQERFLELQREAREARRGLWEPIPASAAPGEVIVDPDCSQYDAPGDDQLNPNEEYICFTNHSDHPVDMTGWSVSRRPNTWYTFPTFILQPQESVRLHSGTEVDTGTDLYWGSNEALWRNIHDSVYLYDADGKLMDEYSW